MTLAELKTKKKEIEEAIKILETGGEYAANGLLKYSKNTKSDYPYQVSAQSLVTMCYREDGQRNRTKVEKWFPFIRCKNRKEVIETIDKILIDLKLLKDQMIKLDEEEFTKEV